METPPRFEDIYPAQAEFLMRVYAAGGYFRQPRTGPSVILPKLPSITGLARNSKCPCGSGIKTKKCHSEWLE